MGPQLFYAFFSTLQLAHKRSTTCLIVCPSSVTLTRGRCARRLCASWNFSPTAIAGGDRCIAYIPPSVLLISRSRWIIENEPFESAVGIDEWNRLRRHAVAPSE